MNQPKRMKPKSLDEILALLRQPEMQSWWAEVLKRRAELEAAQKQQAELLSEASLTEFRSELCRSTM